MLTSTMYRRLCQMPYVGATVLDDASEADENRTTKVLFTAGESHSRLSLAGAATAVVIPYQQSIRTLKLCA